MARKQQDKINRIKNHLNRFGQIGKITNFHYAPGEKVELATINITIDKGLASKLVEEVNKELRDFGQIAFYSDNNESKAIIYPNQVNISDNCPNPDSWPNPILSRYYATQQFLLKLPRVLNNYSQKNQ
ncbi:MAG: hypothetical protein ACP5D2_03790 [Candidatus Nanoarchaeia archaeon]